MPEFPDPDERESLANMKRYLALKERGFYGNGNYHIVIAERGDEIVGGSVFDYLAVPNAGVIEFLFSAPSARGQGVGKALFLATQRILRADARVRVARPLAAITAEMNDPFKRPSTPDNMDPFARAMIWAKWGFSKLEFPYVQPALSAGQSPVEGLVLLAKPMARSTSVPSAWVQSVVGEYMRWAMRIPRPERNAEFREMARWLAAKGRVKLTPLDRYVGRDPARAFEVREATRGKAFAEALAIIQREVKGRGRVESRAGFERAVANKKRGQRYHLWALNRLGARKAEGAASFFSLPSVGFGGYLALSGQLRGRGFLRPVIARIEQQMLRDSPRASGWLIETGAEPLRAFEAVGFAELPVEYRPPSVGRARASGAEPEQLHLLYKPFGSVHRPSAPAMKDVLEAIAEVLEHVYGVARPRQHACYRRVLSTARQHSSAEERARTRQKAPDTHDVSSSERRFELPGSCARAST